MPDNGLVKESLNATFINRRDWIDKSKSTKISLFAMIEIFPCFTNNSCLQNELSLITEQKTLDEFLGYSSVA